MYGFIEDLQNLAGDQAEAFTPWLGPEAARAWEAVNRFWNPPD